MNKKLSVFESICILTMISINTILLNAPKILLNTTGTGAFINCIFVGFIAFIFTIILNKLFKKFPNSDILDISNFLGGKILKIIIGFLFIFVLFIGICISLSHITVLLKTVYFRKSPFLFLLLIFIMGILFGNLFRIWSYKKFYMFLFSNHCHNFINNIKKQS